MKGAGGDQIDPPPLPGKITLKKPSLIRVKIIISLLPGSGLEGLRKNFTFLAVRSRMFNNMGKHRKHIRTR